MADCKKNRIFAKISCRGGAVTRPPKIKDFRISRREITDISPLGEESGSASFPGGSLPRPYMAKYDLLPNYFLAGCDEKLLNLLRICGTMPLEMMTASPTGTAP